MRERLTIILMAVLLLAAVVPGMCAKPASTEDSFGVGARADAMGDAFVAIANDATATFWNPAGLTQIPGRQFTTVTKALPKMTENVKISSSVGDPVYPYYQGSKYADSDATRSESDSLDMSFYSLNLPLDKGGNRLGMFGISHALVGYFDRPLVMDQKIKDALGHDAAGLYRALTEVRDRVQVEHTTLAYAWQPGGLARYGVGLVQATMAFSAGGSMSQFYNDGTPTDIFDMPFAENSGKGYGFTTGALWNPKSKTGTYTVGATYLSKINIKNVYSPVFGDQRPDRIMLGVSYTGTVNNAAKDGYTWSWQVSRSGSANRSDKGGLATRRAVFNMNLGGEYEMRRGKFNYPLRLGMFTNSSPNDVVYGDEKWLTFGFGAGRADKSWQSEVAIQRGIESKLSLVSMSAICYLK